MAQIMIIFKTLARDLTSTTCRWEINKCYLLKKKQISALAQTLLHNHTSPLVFLFPVMSFSQLILPFCLMLILFGSLGFPPVEGRCVKGTVGKIGLFLFHISSEYEHVHANKSGQKASRQAPCLVTYC